MVKSVSFSYEDPNDFLDILNKTIYSLGFWGRDPTKWVGLIPKTQWDSLMGDLCNPVISHCPEIKQHDKKDIPEEARIFGIDFMPSDAVNKCILILKYKYNAEYEYDY